MRKILLTVLAAGSVAVAAHGANIDLSTWTPLTLQFPGGQPAANWVIQPGNDSVIQTVNADPSFFLNNRNQTAFSMDGTWRVNTGSDDDYMGFVFGYQNSANFYLFDWKQGTQGYVGTTAAEGMTIKQFTGATGNGLVDLSLPEFWENESDYGDMEVLATNHGTDKGWLDNRLYSFHLDFNVVPGQFSVVVRDGDTVLWDTTVIDNTFTGGQFGFYNNSQGEVEYAGFVQTGGRPVVPDAGSSAALLTLALGGLAVFRRFKK
jgi:hypothetical protein